MVVPALAQTSKLSHTQKLQKASGIKAPEAKPDAVDEIGDQNLKYEEEHTLSEDDGGWATVILRIEKGLKWLVSARSVVRQEAKQQQIELGLDQLRAIHRQVDQSVNKVIAALIHLKNAAQSRANNIAELARNAQAELDAVYDLWQQQRAQRVELFGKTSGYKDRLENLPSTSKSRLLSKDEVEKLQKFHTSMMFYLSTSESMYQHEFGSILAMCNARLNWIERDGRPNEEEISKLIEHLKEYSVRKTNQWAVVSKMSVMLE